MASPKDGVGKASLPGVTVNRGNGTVEEISGSRDPREVGGAVVIGYASPPDPEGFLGERAGRRGLPQHRRFFGVTSAGDWWGRAGGAAMRLAHYVIGYINAVYALLYSDDGKVIGRTEHYERGIMMFFSP